MSLSHSLSPLLSLSRPLSFPFLSGRADISGGLPHGSRPGKAEYHLSEPDVFSPFAHQTQHTHIYRDSTGYNGIYPLTDYQESLNPGFIPAEGRYFLVRCNNTKTRNGSPSAQKPQLKTLRTANSFLFLSIFKFTHQFSARTNRGLEAGGTSMLWSPDFTKRPRGRLETEKIRRAVLEY